MHVPEMKRGNGNPRFRGNGGKLREKFGERTEKKRQRILPEVSVSYI